MKKYLNLISPVLLAIIVSMNSCRKQDPDPIEGPDEGQSVLFFTNQTNDPEAEALQAILSAGTDGDVIKIYGNFTSTGIPDKPLNVRYEKANNDTVVNFLIDKESGLLHTSIIEVGGTRSNIVLTYEYPEPEDVIRVSAYDYNWSAQSGELLYSALYTKNDDGVEGVPDFMKSFDVGGFILSVASAIIVVEGVSAVGAVAFSALTVAAGAAGAIVTTAVVGGLLVAALSSTLANANEISPQDMPYPDGIAPLNPIADSEELNLPANPCMDSSIEVVIGIDPGNQLTAIAQGGDGGMYTFYWSTGETGLSNASHTIMAMEEGEYYVVATDETGCAAYHSVVVGNDAYSLSILSGNNQSAIAESELPNPIAVKVVDANDQPIQGVDVSFSPSSGGTVSSNSVQTDINGEAVVIWSLGSSTGNQTVQVTAIASNGLPVANSPLQFSATSIDPVVGVWEMFSGSKNEEYSTVAPLGLTTYYEAVDEVFGVHDCAGYWQFDTQCSGDQFPFHEQRNTIANSYNFNADGTYTVTVNFTRDDVITDFSQSLCSISSLGSLNQNYTYSGTWSIANNVLTLNEDDDIHGLRVYEKEINFITVDELEIEDITTNGNVSNAYTRRFSRQ